MKTNSLSEALSGFWFELREPAVLWQIGVLAVCLALGWLLARLLRGRFDVREVPLKMVRLGVESFARVLAPALALVLMAVARPLLQHWHEVSLFRFAMPLVATFALMRLVFYILRRVFRHGGSVGTFLPLFERVFAAVLWVSVALYITGLWPDLLRYLDESAVPIGRHRVSLLVALQAGISVLVTLILALWAGATLEERLMRVETMHSSLRVVMARMGRAVLILLAVLISLSLVGIDLTVLSVFGGALGVGLGLGLQRIVSSYVSGFVILLERNLAIGDMVAVDKYSGIITQINARYTVVRGLDGIETVVPNQLLLSTPVQNYSLSDRLLRLSTQLTVRYATDIDEVLRLLEQAAVGVPRVLAEPAPQVFLQGFEADGFRLELGIWINDPENGRLNVLSQVNRAVWKALRAHGVEVSHPQREIRLVDPAVDYPRQSAQLPAQ
jgi:small-conductance mechanosensitive channel